MIIVIKIINLIFKFIFYPVEMLPPLWGLIVISLLTGILMLTVFRYTSNPKAIKQAKDKARAYMFELVLYRDNLRVILKAIMNIFKYNLRYLRQMLIPFLIIAIPMILILIQLNVRYEFRPIAPGESILVKLHLHHKIVNDNLNISLNVPEQMKVETPVLRMKNQGEVNWRIKVVDAGQHDVKVFVGDEEVKKSIRAAPGLAMLSPLRVYPTFFKMLFNPGETPLPKKSLIESIEVKYPHRHLKIFNYDVHWLVIFFILSMVSAFVLKGVFKVEI